MRRIRLGVIAGCASALAGCWTSQEQSSISPYVRDIRIQPGVLVVDSCSLTYTKTTDHHWLSSMFFGGGTSSTSVNLTEGGCIAQTTPVGGAR